MQRGKYTARIDQRPFGTHLFHWAHIKKHLFEGGRFGVFWYGFPAIIAVSCVLTKGGI